MGWRVGAFRLLDLFGIREVVLLEVLVGKGGGSGYTISAWRGVIGYTMRIFGYRDLCTIMHYSGFARSPETTLWRVRFVVPHLVLMLWTRICK